MDITKMGLQRLKCRYGASNGLDREPANELQRCGLNSRQLAELLWDYGQDKWRQSKTEANEIASKNRRTARNRRNRRSRQRSQHLRIDRVVQMKQGIVIVGKNFNSSACNGSCPF